MDSDEAELREAIDRVTRARLLLERRLRELRRVRDRVIGAHDQATRSKLANSFSTVTPLAPARRRAAAMLKHTEIEGF